MEYLSHAGDASTSVIELNDSTRALLIWLALSARGITDRNVLVMLPRVATGNGGVFTI